MCFLPRFCRGVLLCVISAASLWAAPKWTKVTTQNVTIYTADRAATAKEWAIGIEGFRASLQDWFKTGNQQLEPMTLVVFEGDAAYSKFMGTKRGMDRDMNYNVSRFAFVNGRFMAAINSDYAEVTHHSIFTQSGVWLSGSFKRPMPLWLISGLQEVYGDFSLEGDRMMIGGRVAQNVLSLGQEGIYLPLDQMFVVNTHSKFYTDDREGRFNAQAWAFVHFLLFGDKGANRPGLIRYVTQLQSGTGADEAWVEAFPEGVPALNERFKRYVRTGSYRMVALPQTVTELSKAIAITRPDAAEIDAVMGMLALRMRDVSVAADFVQKAVQAAPERVLTLEAQGDLALVRADRKAAREFYTRAVAGGSTFYFASFYPAMDRAQMMFGGEIATDNYDPVIAREVAELMKKTIQQRPAFYPAREMFAGLVGSLDAVNKDDRQVLDESLLLFPNKGVIEAALAAYEIKTDNWRSAKTRIDRVRNGELDTPNYVQPYALKLDHRLAAVVNLYWARRHYEKGEYAESRASIDKLLRAPLRPFERNEFNSLVASVSAEETFAMVREAIDRKDFSLAAVWLRDLNVDELVPNAVVKLNLLKAEIAAAQK